ncbi:UPF0481 protein At3g47200-like [Rhododendron vialii]|uniref:UPF0481 protein At3g47200-like n=1 Tax=Rhododendron vialii TaxID=182163 RepID=UPI00265FF585|nr:UPF0481 protein At3g47200-like [Rhododendron vialii]
MLNSTGEREDDNHPGGKTDPIFGNRSTLPDVKNDLVLLENQIPFLVLEKLFALTVGRIQDRLDNLSLTDYVRKCYSGWMSTNWCSPRDCVLRVFGCTAAEEEEEGQNGNIDDHRTAKYYHILHNLHDVYLPPHDQTKQIQLDYKEMPSASELVYAGVKFVPDAGNDLFTEPKGLFWWCHRARFEIPPLVIDDHTESYLRNLIALEQCCPGVSMHVSSYAFVMDLLVDNEKDIQVFEKAGVLRNCLGGPAEDAADIFNKLCKEIALGEYFTDTRSKATKYSKRFWPKNMAHVKRTYFGSPWTFIAFCVGFIVFIMAVLQFVHDFFKKSG